MYIVRLKCKILQNICRDRENRKKTKQKLEIICARDSTVCVNGYDDLALHDGDHHDRMIMEKC